MEIDDIPQTFGHDENLDQESVLVVEDGGQVRIVINKFSFWTISLI